MSKYDIWALSEGMCIYNANSVFVALLLSYILLAINLINFYLQKIKYSLFFIIISILMIAYWDPLIYDKLKIDNAPCQSQGWSEIRIKQTKDNLNYSVNNFNSNKCENLCISLHDEMQNHTGGDWRKFRG